MASAWFVLCVGVVFAAAGTVLATNYHDLVAKHIKVAQQWSPFRREPLDPAPFIVLERVLGAVFAVLGTALLVLAIADLIVGPGRFIQQGP
jgi:hypothetical protein